MENRFLSSEKNDNFSILRGIDLQQLLLETEKYYLEYRDKLNLPKDVTFGVEIEYENTSEFIVDRFICRKLPGWRSKTDSSLNSGGEVTSPVMIDKEQYWKELKMVCNYLEKKDADTLHNAGGHIHVGAHVLGNDVDSWRNFLKLYIAYENVMFRFIYGDKISARKRMVYYAPPIADIFYGYLSKINEAQTIEDISNFLPYLGKYSALNLNNVHFWNILDKQGKNTLEFRAPNASTNEVVWQNNINTFTKMILTSRDKVMDEEFLDYKLENEYLPYRENAYLYNNISLKNVLEFVDLVFDNNLDKIYFLRQYLKNFEDNYGIKKAVYTKRFVK